MLELKDIQGIVLDGYSKLVSASFVLLSIGNTELAREWLGRQRPRVAGHTRAEPSTNVALTSAGLRALGLDERTLASFPIEFGQGMATDVRQRILGDVDESDPTLWHWGGPKTPPVHLLLMLYASSDPELADLVAKSQKAWEECALTCVKTLDTRALPDLKEHFGFHDGISQVPIRGYRGRESGVAAGEFLLGYPNEYDKYTAAPKVPAGLDPNRILPQADGIGDLGRNGSYLVFRQLGQDVYGFWKWLDEKAEGDPALRAQIAAKMVGRWPGGASLERHPLHEPSHPYKPDNDFLYAKDDAFGDRCPLGSHIRRTNPRDALGKAKPGDLTLSNLHRIVRRGRPYGAPSAADLKPESILAAGPDIVDRGLHFLCLNANIERQFEFVQQTWANSAKFASLRNDPDPLIGARYQPKSQFTIQEKAVRRRFVGMPNFVTVRGGAYFFLPGITALSYLAKLPK